MFFKKQYLSIVVYLSHIFSSLEKINYHELNNLSLDRQPLGNTAKKPIKNES